MRTERNSNTGRLKAKLKCLALAMVALAACDPLEKYDPPGDISTNIPSTTPQSKSENHIDSSASSPAQAKANACLFQNGKDISANRMRAIGTEPFWGARIEGRCVTYSHPEDQTGFRIWTRFSGSAEAGEWIGKYGAKPFVLRTRPQRDCSDGMSDRRYPIAVTLTVGGEQRQGCAEPL